MRAGGYVGAGRERGSASIWVLAFSALLIALTMVAVIRTEAVLSRHRAESAADLAALAAAGQIGLSPDPCLAAGRIATANHATVRSCVLSLAADGRAGTVSIAISLTVRLPVVGSEVINAHARAARDPVPP